ncbi:hypothetical protein D3C71_2004160 [compost metagenome]
MNTGVRCRISAVGVPSGNCAAMMSTVPDIVAEGASMPLKMVMGASLPSSTSVWIARRPISAPHRIRPTVRSSPEGSQVANLGAV